MERSIQWRWKNERVVLVDACGISVGEYNAIWNMVRRCLDENQLHIL